MFAASLFSSVLLDYASINSSLVSLEIEFPGLIKFTSTSPIITAITVVNIYVIIVLPPIFESLDISFKSETPLIREARINGIAINFNKFMNIVPKMKKVSLVDILNKNELNGEEIFQEAISQKSNDIIEANMKLAKSLGLRGTPASIVNDSIYPGYLQYKTLETLIK